METPLAIMSMTMLLLYPVTVLAWRRWPQHFELSPAISVSACLTLSAALTALTIRGGA